MWEYEPRNSPFSEYTIRLVRETDAPDVAAVFDSTYKGKYAYAEVSDGTWFKRAVYNDGIVCVVAEKDGKIVGTGSVLLDYGGYNDQIGELARLAVAPEHAGAGVGRLILDTLFEIVDEHVEFAVGESRTQNMFSQKMVEKAGCTHIGLLPHYFALEGRWESAVPYAKLFGTGRELRSAERPRIIPEVERLARHVLGEMRLPDNLIVEENCDPYESKDHCTIQQMERQALARLDHIEHGRLVEPLLFGSVSLAQGWSLIRRRGVEYRMAVDGAGQPVGAVGFQVNQTNRILKGVEMVGKERGVRGLLCHSLVDEAEASGERIVEVNVSAYDPRLQRTFYELGFRPVAYAPAMVFHKTERLDVVKMIKLNVPYEPGGMLLTEKAGEVVSIVEDGLLI